ncbi:MAG: peptide deformylase [Phycisphaeraceae bacterium]|jgi:peptide deformylase|nr:MAG: peptide deformylase [Phycisphaeraceae bacterium]
MSRENRPVWVVPPYTLRIDPSGLQIVSWPDPGLRSRATHVPSAEEVALVAPRMVELMHEASGIGLAAPQVGLPWRMFVTCVPDADPVDRVFVNPEIHLDLCGAPPQPYEEGCLSLPDLRLDVLRPKGASISATGADGSPFELSDAGLLARVWQHEYDHLEGRLIFDLAQPVDASLVKRWRKVHDAQ